MSVSTLTEIEERHSREAIEAEIVRLKSALGSCRAGRSRRSNLEAFFA